MVFVFLINFFLLAHCDWPISASSFLGVDLCEYDVLGVVCKCPLRKNMIEEIQKLLDENLFGQDEPKEMLINALRLHNFASGGRATVVHIAGDNGVGKSMATNLIAQGVFKRTANGQPDGYEYIRGNSFRGDTKEEILKHKAIIEERLARQLHKCPHSMIVIDEVEVMHAETIRIFQQFLDSSHNILEINNYKVHIDQAIYFFVSDFGVEGRTDGMPLEKIKELIHRDALRNWQDIKTSALVQHIVPFLPQSSTGVKNLVQHQFQKLKDHHTLHSQRLTVSRITYSQADLETATELIEKKSHEKLSNFKNYRGVLQVFDELVVIHYLKSISSYKNAVIEVEMSVVSGKVVFNAKKHEKLKKEI